MKKSEIFDEILAKVCDVCEVRADSVLGGSRIQAVVDARVLCVQYCRRAGLSSDDIALIVLRRLAGDSELCPDWKELHNKAKGVDKMFTAYGDRRIQSFSFCLMSKEIKEYVRRRYMELHEGNMKQLP